MYLLYADEANTDPSSSDFFAYVGVAIHHSQVGELSAEIDRIRSEYGYQATDLLKFNTRERPQWVTPDAHRDAKKAVLEAAANSQVTAFVSMILHNVASSMEEARRKEINRICYHFDCFLQRRDDHGLVLIDTFTDEQLRAILQEKFHVGLRGLPFSDPYRLNRILGIHLACIGSSNFCSLVDIVVGSFRYILNERRNQQREQVVSILLNQLNPLFIRQPEDGTIDEISMFFSPKTVKHPPYFTEYVALHRFLSSKGLEPAQQPCSA